MRVIRVALDVPLPRVFDYRCDDASDDDIGLRALVPFRRRQQIGVIVEIAQDSLVSSEKLRNCTQIFREGPKLGPDWIALGKFCSQYYQAALGEVLLGALPPRLKSPVPLPAVPYAYAITDRGRVAIASLSSRQASKRQLLELLKQGTQG